MSILESQGLARVVADFVESHRATRTARDASGRVVIPSFDDLGDDAKRLSAAKDLIKAACMIHPSVAKAIGVACANAKGSDHDLLRELVSLLPVE